MFVCICLHADWRPVDRGGRDSAVLNVNVELPPCRDIPLRSLLYLRLISRIPWCNIFVSGSLVFLPSRSSYARASRHGMVIPLSDRRHLLLSNLTTSRPVLAATTRRRLWSSTLGSGGSHFLGNTLDTLCARVRLLMQLSRLHSQGLGSSGSVTWTNITESRMCTSMGR